MDKEEEFKRRRAPHHNTHHDGGERAKIRSERNSYDLSLVQRTVSLSDIRAAVEDYLKSEQW